MALKDLFKKKCPVCKMVLGKKTVDYKGKKFCSKQCADKFKKSEKAHVCEHC